MSPVGAPQAAPTTARRTESSGLLEVEGLTLGLRRGGREVRIVEGVDLTVGAGQRVGLVGESALAHGKSRNAPTMTPTAQRRVPSRSRSIARKTSSGERRSTTLGDR